MMEGGVAEPRRELANSGVHLAARARRLGCVAISAKPPSAPPPDNFPAAPRLARKPSCRARPGAPDCGA